MCLLFIYVQFYEIHEAFIYSFIYLSNYFFHYFDSLSKIGIALGEIFI